MLEAALAAGVAAAGGDVLLGGVLPTPAAPLLLGRYGFDLAAVISASHNPFQDNGIKFFGPDGFKLSDATEAAIEARLDDDAAASTAIGRVAGAPRHAGGLPARARRPLRRPRPRGPRRRPGLRARGDARGRAGGLPAPGRRRSPCSAPPRTGGTSTPAAGRPTWARSARPSPRAATTSASPSTATATGCWPSTGPARSSTATSSSRWRPCTCAARAGCPAAASRSP